uniref:Uncharacterized protein n=1 Tax=Timema douglasi TaxID=61478 RepID=A0A7R8VK11_TIMDO|nr:unnamed protein product [Timema douglasi]
MQLSLEHPRRFEELVGLQVVVTMLKVKKPNDMEGNSPEYVDVSNNSDERDLYQRELVCDLPFIKEELESRHNTVDTDISYTSTEGSDMEADTDGQGTFTIADKLGRKRKCKLRQNTHTKKTLTLTNKYEALTMAADQLTTQDDPAQQTKSDQPKTDYDLIQHLLKDMKQEFHTYTLPRDKPVKVVIKGLPLNMATEDIQNELMGYPVTDASSSTFPQLRSRHNQPISEEARDPPPLTQKDNSTAAGIHRSYAAAVQGQRARSQPPN